MSHLKSPVGQYKTEALQALAVVLRGAHDDSHPFAAQCQGFPGRLVGRFSPCAVVIYAPFFE